MRLPKLVQSATAKVAIASIFSSHLVLGLTDIRQIFQVPPGNLPGGCSEQQLAHLNRYFDEAFEMASVGHAVASTMENRQTQVREDRARVFWQLFGMNMMVWKHLATNPAQSLQDQMSRYLPFVRDILRDISPNQIAPNGVQKSLLYCRPDFMIWTEYVYQGRTKTQQPLADTPYTNGRKGSFYWADKNAYFTPADVEPPNPVCQDGGTFAQHAGGMDTITICPRFWTDTTHHESLRLYRSAAQGGGNRALPLQGPGGRDTIIDDMVSLPGILLHEMSHLVRDPCSPVANQESVMDFPAVEPVYGPNPQGPNLPHVFVYWADRPPGELTYYWKLCTYLALYPGPAIAVRNADNYRLWCTAAYLDSVDWRNGVMAPKTFSVVPR